MTPHREGNTLSNPNEYAGNVDVKAAFEAISENENALIVDVRTKAEWQFVGVPNLAPVGKEAVFVEWQGFPVTEPGHDFVSALSQKISEKGLDQSAAIYFLCRSGARSQSAATAMTQAGYANCYNILDGFEGSLDQNGHRGTQGGWKAAGLPWAQS